MTSRNKTDSKSFAHLPHSQAAENNKLAILNGWKSLELAKRRVFEVGSGTGQHGVFFCRHCPELHWQPSEVADNLAVLKSWHQAAKEEGIANFLPPVLFDITNKEWPEFRFDTVYSANVLHIVSRDVARSLIELLTAGLSSGQQFVCYGPFKLDGQFTTDSNREFDTWLKQQGYGGLLDMAQIQDWSEQQLVLKRRLDMPANNFLLLFEKGE